MTDDTIESQLEIANASQADAGTYTCKAITLRDEAEKKVNHSFHTVHSLRYRSIHCVVYAQKCAE